MTCEHNPGYVASLRPPTLYSGVTEEVIREAGKDPKNFLQALERSSCRQKKILILQPY